MEEEGPLFCCCCYNLREILRCVNVDRNEPVGVETLII